MRTLLQEELTNKIVMTNYGKTTFYKILKIYFEKGENVFLSENISMLEYYRKRYNKTIK